MPEHLDADLRGHDVEILTFLEQEELQHFSFDGLQRSMQMHPETLSRSLTRLEEEALIQKTPEGYRLLTRGAHPAQLTERHTIQLAQTLLPTQTTSSTLLQRLKGRWFGRLRWLGYSQHANGLTLKWTTADGRIHLHAKQEGPLLTLQASLREETPLDEAVPLAHQLLSQLTATYAHQPNARLASYVLYNPANAAAL